jgi:hypothetical protein
MIERSFDQVDEFMKTLLKIVTAKGIRCDVCDLPYRVL